MKAFKVTIPNVFDEMVIIYSALSAGKARYSALASIQEAGYSVKFGDILVVRSPEYDCDAIKSKHTEQIGWREYIGSDASYGVLQTK